MCGIVGYVGFRQATPLLVEGLKRLEYRGYDSAGLAVWDGRQIGVRRAVGNLANLARLTHELPLSGSIGLGHTRWATHGAPNIANAHPHLSMDGRHVVVHNGIVENARALRRELEQAGVVFQSDT